MKERYIPLKKFSNDLPLRCHPRTRKALFFKEKQRLFLIRGSHLRLRSSGEESLTFATQSKAFLPKDDTRGKGMREIMMYAVIQR